MSSTVLSCLTEVSDVASLPTTINISGSSIKFLVDNVLLDAAAWACQTDCFANNPTADLAAGLGELELRPESLRYAACVNRDLLEDASVDLEAWMLGKVNTAYRNTISNAIISGTGVGMPGGILNPNSGIQICDTAASTPVGQFTWQDAIMLKWSVPIQYHPNGAYICNQNTFALILTMTDAAGRPIMIADPTQPSRYLINGSPVIITTQMPDCVPGATPLMFADFKKLYILVVRKAVTMLQDPFTMGYCILFRFDARVGGGVVCPSAGKLLRVR